MGWKHCRLWVKLTIGFGSILALLLMQGAWSVFGIRTIVSNAETVIGGKALRDELSQWLIAHLTWAGQVDALLIDPRVQTLDFPTDPAQCDFGRWLAGRVRTQAEAVVPAMAPLLAEIEAAHEALHASAAAIAEAYAPADLTRGLVLRERKLEHLLWLNGIRDALLDPAARSIGVATEPSQCGLGQWLLSAEVAAQAQADP